LTFKPKAFQRLENRKSDKNSLGMETNSKNSLPLSVVCRFARGKTPLYVGKVSSLGLCLSGLAGLAGADHESVLSDW
jgi:hypothetical protein